MPPEKCAYALARYSRSPDSIRQSLEWVRTHNTQQFLEHYYFQYGHASIADLGHAVLCFEGVSELAASEAEDETLWDGQAKSSRYQDFSTSGFIVPPEFDSSQTTLYQAEGERLLAAYAQVHARVTDHLQEKLPRPAEMKPDAYARNIAARAFDVARYLLFWGIPTNVGQVTSIRTLEKQIRRLRASDYAEVRELGSEIAQSCAQQPDCLWPGGLGPAGLGPEGLGNDAVTEPLAPTLARHADPDAYLQQSREDLRSWAAANLGPTPQREASRVELVRPRDSIAEIVATLLYPVTDWPFADLYECAHYWSRAHQMEVVDLSLKSRGRRDDLLRGFRGGEYCFDMAIDVGAYRDMHRHRRCHQYRQDYSGSLGFDVPDALAPSGAETVYREAMDGALTTMRKLPAPGAHYLLPFGARSRFLFKMDFAEVEYISRVRSGVKGHFSYRDIAWQMKKRVEEVEPELGRLIDATPPWVEDPLKR